MLSAASAGKCDVKGGSAKMPLNIFIITSSSGLRNSRKAVVKSECCPMVLHTIWRISWWTGFNLASTGFRLSHRQSASLPHDVQDLYRVPQNAPHDVNSNSNNSYKATAKTTVTTPASTTTICVLRCSATCQAQFVSSCAGWAAGSGGRERYDAINPFHHKLQRDCGIRAWQYEHIRNFIIETSRAVHWSNDQWNSTGQSGISN